jgi:hypothetical protein
LSRKSLKACFFPGMATLLLEHVVFPSGPIGSRTNPNQSQATAEAGGNPRKPCKHGKRDSRTAATLNFCLCWLTLSCDSGYNHLRDRVHNTRYLLRALDNFPLLPGGGQVADNLRNSLHWQNKMVFLLCPRPSAFI